MLEEKILNKENSENKASEPLFTKSRILFLVVVFIVVSMPLLYRNLDFLLK